MTVHVAAAACTAELAGRRHRVCGCVSPNSCDYMQWNSPTVWVQHRCCLRPTKGLTVPSVQAVPAAAPAHSVAKKPGRLQLLTRPGMRAVTHSPSHTLKQGVGQQRAHVSSQLVVAWWPCDACCIGVKLLCSLLTYQCKVEECLSLRNIAECHTLAIPYTIPYTMWACCHITGCSAVAHQMSTSTAWSTSWVAGTA
jgi:hypothetical protein